ncbi:MAG TPA: NepR family anti-sigma factor, partial [Paracoccaceae bacterium]|nr:NepR family anti-sigma factor [Paracoccaceae bacterium]
MPANAADSALAREIDANLKRVYAAALDPVVPDRFAQLLQQLREKEGRS